MSSTVANDRARRRWDARAAGYDRLPWVHDDDLLGWVAGLTAAALARVPLKGRATGLRVQEVGCGTGALTARLVRLPGVVHVDAVDVSQAMVEACRARLLGGAAFGDAAWDLLCGDDLHVGSSGASYDAVVSRMVLHHAPDEPAAAVARWARRLRPGGCVVVAEGPPPSSDNAHPGVELYVAAMAVKEPDRWYLHANQIAQHLFDAGCREVATWERWTDGNSVRAWLAGQDLDDGTQERVLRLHRAAGSEAREVYRIRETDDGDVVMRWRHCVVAGWV